MCKRLREHLIAAVIIVLSTSIKTDMARVTLKDVAAHLGLSPSTVSRALRNHSALSEATVKRVQQAADDLDYFPDILAQGLKSRRTNTIGIIVPEIRHDFFSSTISGIEEIAYGDDFTIMVCQSNENVKREIINLKSLIANRVAGILVSISQTSEDISHFELARKREIPLVFFDRSHHDIQEPQVIVDDYNGTVKLITHLLKAGYRRIAHLAGPAHISIGRHRLQGYLDTHKKMGIEVNKNLIFETGFMENDGVEGAKRLLAEKKKVDAIFAVNDPVALGALSVLKKNKVRVPEDIALVGFSNNSVSSQIDPPLTTVNQPAREIGKAAARLLLKKILSPETIDIPLITELQTRLVIRESA